MRRKDNGRQLELGRAFYSEQLARAREMRAMTRSELAERVGKSTSAISQFERGVCAPDEKTLKRIALALSFPLSFFGRPSRVDNRALEHCHFRSLRTSSAYKRRQSRSVAGLCLELFDILSEELRVQTAAFVSLQHEIQEQPELTPSEVADIVRDRWGLERRPLHNLLRIFEQNGVIILPLTFRYREVDAFSFWYGEYPVMCLDLNKPASRVCFDAAHELGHLLMHAEASPGEMVLEREANAFAAAFLMPADLFKRSCPKRWSLKKFTDLKAIWHVSIQAMVMRAHALGNLTDASKVNAFRTINKQKIRYKEPGEWELARPRLLLAWVSSVSERWSVSDLATMLDVFPKDIYDVLAPLDSAEADVCSPDEVSDKQSNIELL